MLVQLFSSHTYIYNFNENVMHNSMPRGATICNFTEMRGRAICNLDLQVTGHCPCCQNSFTCMCMGDSIRRILVGVGM